MSDYWHLSGDAGGSRVKSFATTGRNGKTTVRVEIEITDPWEVGSILRQLHEAQAPPPKERAADVTKPPPPRVPKTLAQPAPERNT